jgi:HPt (histidine-containing phosphotransfer) domain-containing protein
MRLVSRGFDEALISSVMPICLGDNRKRLQELTLALKTHRAEDVRLFAHAIKGSCAMVGAVKLAQIACRLEEKAKQGDLSQAEQLLSGVEKGFHELESLVSKPDWTKVVKGQAKPVGAAQGNRIGNHGGHEVTGPWP